MEGRFCGRRRLRAGFDLAGMSSNMARGNPAFSSLTSTELSTIVPDRRCLAKHHAGLFVKAAWADTATLQKSGDIPCLHFVRYKNRPANDGARQF